MAENINEYGIIDPECEKCNHRIKSRKTSIVLLPEHRTFTYPEHIFGVCKFCGKPFDYIKDRKGCLKIYKENENKEDGQIC